MFFNTTKEGKRNAIRDITETKDGSSKHYEIKKQLERKASQATMHHKGGSNPAQITKSKNDAERKKEEFKNSYEDYERRETKR